MSDMLAEWRVTGTVPGYMTSLHYSLSSDGKKVVTINHDDSIRVFEVPSGRLLAMMHGHKGPVNQAVCSAGFRSGDRAIGRDTEKQRTARMVKVHSRRLAVVAAAGFIGAEICDVMSGEILLHLKPPGEDKLVNDLIRRNALTFVNCPSVAITPDGNHILSGQESI
jgi:WD40 repeat protein